MSIYATINNWKIFRLILARIDAKERKTAAGRKLTCRVLMFKLAQKDIDARWPKKGGQNHYGYKNHNQH